MDKKKIVWMLGSNATGKTTQSKLLHDKFGNGEKRTFSFKEADQPVKFTTFGTNIGHVGIVGDNQCTGTDTLNSKLSIENSLIYCLNECDIVVVDGILATATWIDIFNQFPDTVETYCILLQFSTIEANLKRVAERRAYKRIESGGNDLSDIADFDIIVDQELDKIIDSDKTIKNISSKFKSFKSIYERVKNKCVKNTEILADLPPDQIFSQIHKLIL